MKTKTKKTALAVGQVWRETKTGRQLRVVGLGAKVAACAYRFGTTGRFTAVTEDVPVETLLGRRYTFIRA